MRTSQPPNVQAREWKMSMKIAFKYEAALIWIKFGAKRFSNKNSPESSHSVCMSSGAFCNRTWNDLNCFLIFVVQLLQTHVLCSCSTCTERLLFSCKMRKGIKKKNYSIWKDRQNVHCSSILLALTGSLPSIFRRYDDALFQRAHSLAFWILFTKCFKCQSKPSDRTHSHPTDTNFFQYAHTLRTLTLIKRFSSFCHRKFYPKRYAIVCVDFRITSLISY